MVSTVRKRGLSRGVSGKLGTKVQVFTRVSIKTSVRQSDLTQGVNGRHDTNV